jgi:hypothetical protein
MMDPRRALVVEAAKSEIGPGDIPKYWASCGVSPGPKPNEKGGQWCGAFALFCLHQAGLALGQRWVVALGFCGPLKLPTTKHPEPGDVLYDDQPWQHYGVVESLVDGVLTTIEGNTPTVQRKVRPLPPDVVFYSIAKLLAPATQPPAPAPDKPVLHVGVTGALVRELQAKLRLPVTGRFDRATELAVIAYQTAHGIGVDGVVGGRTWHELSLTVLGAARAGGGIRGVDVSSHQPPDKLDYAALAVGHRFLVARAAYGTRPDTTFREHIRRSLDVGLKVSGYLFYRATQPVRAQLDAFCEAADAAGMGPGFLPPALDVEKNEPFDGPMTPERYAPAEELAAALREKYGACLVYTNPQSFKLMGEPEWVREHLLWHAQWGVSEPSVSDWAIWQDRVEPLPEVYAGPIDQDVAESLPLLLPRDPAAPLLLAVDWDEMRDARDTFIRESET